MNLATLIPHYMSGASPFTKVRAVQVIVREGLKRSCNYFHRESARGKGNKAKRRCA